MEKVMSVTKSVATAVVSSIISWSWTKALLSWIIMSAGTMSECVFLIASIWMSINSSVHPFVLLFMSEDTSTHATQLATTAYVALPECILGLAIVTVISHGKMWRYSQSKIDLLWSILFALPTIVFLFLSLFTVANAVISAASLGAHVDFTLPLPLVVARALAGYMFALTSLIYTSLGKPQEADRLRKKDNSIKELRINHENKLVKEREEKELMLAQLRQEKEDIVTKILQEKDGLISRSNRNYENELALLSRDKELIESRLNAEKNLLIVQIENYKTENENYKNRLTESQNKETELLKAVNKSDESALEGYSEECINWLKSGVKSALLDEITAFTGLSKRRISNALEKGILKVTPKNKELITIVSLIEWLKITPSPTGKADPDTSPLLHIVNG